MKEGFPGSRVEATCDHFDHGVLDSLQHVDEALRAMGAVPQLAAIGKDREANGVHDQAPVCHGKSADCVAKHLQSFDRSPGSVAHDPDVWFPLKAVMKEEAEVVDGGSRGDVIRAL